MKRRFQVPQEQQAQKTTALQYLHRAWPEGTTEQIRAVFEAGDVEADGVVVTRPDSPLAPDTVVEARIDEEGREVFGIPEAETLLWDDEWVVVDKPVGVPGWIAGDDPTDPVRFLADFLGLDRDDVAPVWEMPTNAGGPWLVAKRPEVADGLGTDVTAGSVQSTWVALVPEPARPRGSWNTDAGQLRFAVSRTRQGLAEVQLTPDFDADQRRATLYETVLRMLADAGFPALGDASNGGYLVDGAVRLRLQALYGGQDFAHSWSAPRDWWPDQPVIPAPEPAAAATSAEDRQIRQLQVTPETVERLQAETGGHPWIMRGELRPSIEDLPAGSPVELLGPGGPSGLFALVDGTGPVAARLWSRDRAEADGLETEVRIRLDEAVGRRLELFRRMGTTDVFRVAHAEADGLPGLFVDRLGPVWRVTTTGRCARAYRERVYEVVHGYDPKTTVVEVEHLTSQHARRQPPETRVVRSGPSAPPGESIIVREADVRFHANPAAGIAPDLLAAHRDNRRRAVERAEPDQHWLDVRANTGAFSLRLAAAGVETTNVDADGRYFSQLDDNFELNGIPHQRRRNIENDPRSFLAETDEMFDGILVDLAILQRSPTGSETDADGAVEFVADAFQALTPSGDLFVTRPPVGDERPSVDELIERAAETAGRDISEVEPGPPSDDFPTPSNFPEARPFQARWVR